MISSIIISLDWKLSRGNWNWDMFMSWKDEVSETMTWKKWSDWSIVSRIMILTNEILYLWFFVEHNLNVSSFLLFTPGCKYSLKRTQLKCEKKKCEQKKFRHCTSVKLQNEVGPRVIKSDQIRVCAIWFYANSLVAALPWHWQVILRRSFIFRIIEDVLVISLFFSSYPSPTARSPLSKLLLLHREWSVKLSSPHLDDLSFALYQSRICSVRHPLFCSNCHLSIRWIMCLLDSFFW